MPEIDQTVRTKAAADARLPGGIDWAELATRPRCDDSQRVYRVLVADLVGLAFDTEGAPDPLEFAHHVRSRGCEFHLGDVSAARLPAGIHFVYLPELAGKEELLAVTGAGQFDALIAAATFIPEGARFKEGAVRIGAGTGNMTSASWGGGDGPTEHGARFAAPLMNTPGWNSRATAQMVLKALLQVRPDLPLSELHNRVMKGDFDTGRDLGAFPTEKLEGQRIAVLGFGNIGREVALLARAFGMQVAVYARESMRRWIEAEGFEFAATIEQAAQGAQVLSVHLGLGAFHNGAFANADLIDARVLAEVSPSSVLINFDRAELLHVPALAAALAAGQIAWAVIDADVFTASGSEEPATGPLAPFLPLLEEHPDKLLLLPHAAADTDHPSRVAGACQAADQLIAAIRYRCVANLKGALPAGYTNLGACKLPGVGGVIRNTLHALNQNGQTVRELQAELAGLEQWLAGAVGGEFHSEQAQAAVLAANKIQTLLTQLGLSGPGRDL